MRLLEDKYTSGKGQIKVSQAPEPMFLTITSRYKIDSVDTSPVKHSGS